MISISSLEVKPGQRLTLRLWRRLLKAIEERTMRTGRYVRLHHAPNGVIVNTGDGIGGGSGVVFSWQMSADSGPDGGAVVSFFQRGLVNGVEAQIRNDQGVLVQMSTLDANGNTPNLTVTKDKFNSVTGISLIYAKITVNNLATTVIYSVELIGCAALPSRIPFTAWKLIGFILMASGTPVAEQHCFFDQTVVWGVTPQTGIVTSMFVAA